MADYREVCLFLTLNCNQNCRYCHRFLGIKELDFEKVEEIINRVDEDGIKNMTFTGGEPLLYPHIVELLKLAKEKGIKSKIISNGSILATKPEMREIYNYLDSITLSIDSADNIVNEKLGRGYNHFEHIKTVLDSLKDVNLKVNINTVVSRVNLDSLQELGNFLNSYKNINAWRIFKFIPLRETAKKNEKEFEISSEEFRINKTLFASYPNIKKVEYREEPDMESKYVLIMPNGNVVITENKEDVTIGNILENKISVLLNNRISARHTNTAMNKIRTLIAYNSEQGRNEILEAVNKLNYVEVIGVAADGLDTMNKIIDLQPEMVFTKYDLDNIKGLDIVRQSKERLSSKMPIFNFIADNIAEQEFKQVSDIAGYKINSLIPENYKAQRIADILKDYQKFKEA